MHSQPATTELHHNSAPASYVTVNKLLNLTLTFIILEEGIPSPMSQTKAVTVCSAPTTVLRHRILSIQGNSYCNSAISNSPQFSMVSLMIFSTQRASSRKAVSQSTRKMLNGLPATFHQANPRPHLLRPFSHRSPAWDPSTAPSEWNPGASTAPRKNTRLWLQWRFLKPAFPA